MHLINLLPAAFIFQVVGAQTDPVAAISYIVDNQQGRMLIYTPGKCYSPAEKNYPGFESVKTRAFYACSLFRDTQCTDRFATTSGGIKDIHGEFGVNVYSVSCFKQEPEL